MQITIKQADQTMLNDIYNLFLKRIEWFKKKGINQWHASGYTDVYPIAYFKKQIQAKKCYVALRNGEVVGSIVISNKDRCWDNDEIIPSLYIHNFVTDTKTRGIGAQILNYIEEIAREQGKIKLRLDCDKYNDFLNNYYEKRGFKLVGECYLGNYAGNKREKDLVSYEY